MHRKSASKSMPPIDSIDSREGMSEDLKKANMPDRNGSAADKVSILALAKPTESLTKAKGIETNSLSTTMISKITQNKLSDTHNH